MRRVDPCPTQGPSDERGSVAVIVAILLVALLAMAALVIDVGALFQERRELQNGADAAALAVALDCAAGSCGDYEATGSQYASANAVDLLMNVDDYSFTSNSVTVTTSTLTPSGTAIAHWFARVLGYEETTVTAQATATWGVPGGGLGLPLTFSYCEWEILTGGDPNSLPTEPATIYFHTASEAETNQCDGPAGQDTPGGFGWLDPDGSGQCQTSFEDGWADGDTGSGAPSPASSTGCTSSFFADNLGETLIIPIFAQVVGVGSGAQYEIVGFAGFEFLGYRFSGSPAYNSGTYGYPTPCSGDQRCIRARFTYFVEYGEDLEFGDAIDFGAYIVLLTA